MRFYGHIDCCLWTGYIESYEYTCYAFLRPKVRVFSIMLIVYSILSPKYTNFLISASLHLQKGIYENNLSISYTFDFHILISSIIIVHANV